MKSQRIKEAMKKIFCLPLVPTLCIAPLSFALVAYMLAKDIQDSIVADITYVISSYALVMAVIWAVRILRRIPPRTADGPLAKKLSAHPLYGRYIQETFFRLKISLARGLLISLLYAAIELFAGIRYRSFWFVMLACYYVLLVAMRFSLFTFAGEAGNACGNQKLGWEKYRRCGVMLLVMNQVLTGIVIYVVVQNRSFEYPGTLIYAMALYSFYAVIASVRNMVKGGKDADPVTAAARTVNMTAALVSMLSLETAMLSRFGEPGETAFRRAMLSAAGGWVCLTVLGMAVYMILRANTQLKKTD